MSNPSPFGHSPFEKGRLTETTTIYELREQVKVAKEYGEPVVLATRMGWEGVEELKAEAKRLRAEHPDRTRYMVWVTPKPAEKK